MPQQYHATDPNSGLEVTVTGNFPDEPDDRVRIARTSNLFTRLISTILTTDDPRDRRDRFRAIETQLEMADALIRGDMQEVQELMSNTLKSMGVTEEQLKDAEEQLKQQLESLGSDPGAINFIFGTSHADTEKIDALEDISFDDLTLEDLPKIENELSDETEPPDDETEPPDDETI
tara:strand:+ start:673 stop:1200 length:528 start_codon:yes stop_codon:yes gene_type:complete